MKNTPLRFTKSKAFGQALERLVPGGAHTYSKGRDQFPLESPNGITRGEGARVWDADGNCLVDWSMGLTSVSLGHAHPKVNAAVHAEIDRGVNFQRPGAVELKAAETFLDVVGTDMVKFAKHGSVVNTAAVKLARGYTGRAKVAVPRQHPFFSFDDWFIGITEANFAIPDELKRFTVQFNYNDFASVEAMFREHGDDLACVMLEPVKFDAPKDDFLHKLRDLCSRRSVVLILDEMVTGLKFAVPGASRYFDVDAEIYTYGKGIANGYSSAALTGKGDIMRLGGLEPEGARKLFLLSTTHGAESSGLAATIATLEVFRDGSVVRENWNKGEDLRRRLDAITRRNGLAAHISLKGYPCLMAVEYLDSDGRPNADFRTLFLQEMIASGILFQGLFMLTPSHGDMEITETEIAWDRACAVYAHALAAKAVDGLLIGSAVKPVFRRFL